MDRNASASHHPGVKRILAALRQRGVDEEEFTALSSAPQDLAQFWAECADPELLMRVAGAAGLDPRWSVAAACDCAAAVSAYIGADETRPGLALAAGRAWLERAIPAERCQAAADAAEQAAVAYREARKTVAKAERRAYRAAAYAAFAASRAARAAAEAALTTELDYDDDYTFEDAWNGARIACAEGAAAVGKDAVEAAISATAARVTRQTSSDLAGRAAAHEARPGALKWAADLIRARIPAAAITASTEATLGPA